MNPPQLAPTYPPGVPAICPRDVVPGAGAPTYTADDVRQYLAAHPPFTTADGRSPTIDTILFTQAQQARVLLRGASVDRPDAALVCVVVVHGSLSMRGVSRPAGVGPLGPAPTGVLVFDAHTGNILVRGFQEIEGQRSQTPQP